ncbi:hypothetical protein [Azohydromonas caseinilytica]|uniref:Uncharacterized protein n=1 Tax=Azohydromonas caseinilytica TaxID=2728836 RepID=A0A848FFK3_9BURK|nr:hypothetical protein [Azohydromonas caseinilytica]NML17089.1 hypothetical protein [Azohydromonas caseinilytica]
MKRRNFTISVVASGLVPGAYAAGLDQGGQAQPRAAVIPNYDIFSLGTFQGGRSAAFAVSSNRKAAGYVSFDIQGGYRPALFFPGEVPKPIYTDGPGEARGINARIEVVGWFRQGSFTQAFRYRNDTLQTLAALGGGHSHAAGINNRSEIVGWSEAAPGASHAMYWWEQQMVDLGTWGGYAAQATAINERGDIVGFREVVLNGVGVRQGVRLMRGKSPQLMPTPPGFTNVVPTAINNKGDIAGYVHTTDLLWTRQGFIYTAEGEYKLTPMLNGQPTVALGVNNRRDMVGFVFDGNADPRNGGAMWIDEGQTRIRLIPPYDPNQPGWYRLGDVAGINDAGVIVGYGRYRYSDLVWRTEACMLIPRK